MSRSDQMSSDSQRRVVLVADDDNGMLDLVAHVIDGLGLVPLRASDGAAALEFASRCKALLACAVLDIQMPLLNGAEAAHAIQRIVPDLAIVLMSGGFSASLVDRISEIRTVAILQKPFPLSTLREVLVQAAGDGIATGVGMAAANGRGDQREYL